MTFRIVADGTCDLPPEGIADHRFTGVPIRMHGGVAPVIRRARRRRPGGHTGFPTLPKEN